MVLDESGQIDNRVARVIEVTQRAKVLKRSNQTFTLTVCCWLLCRRLTGRLSTVVELEKKSPWTPTQPPSIYR
eukprot:1374687-Amorphochlora_amoeboformis.AAC.1